MRFYRRALVVGGLLVTGIALAIQAAHGLRSLDLASIDARFSIRGSEGPPRNLVVVGIDAATFDYLRTHDPGHGHFPFRRRLDAAVIRNLARAGAKTIAFDEQFTEQTDPADDNALILAVRASRRAVLATTEVAPGGRTGIFGGGAGLAFSRATAADSQFPIDSDGKIRRLRAQVLQLVTFPVAVAERTAGEKIRFPGGSDADVPIDFRGPSGTIPAMSYWRVLAHRFPVNEFRGKVAVIGVTEPILHDVHPVPTDVQMSGAEMQANAADTVLRGFPLRSAPGWINVALVVAFSVFIPALALRIPAPRAMWLGLLALALLAVACQLAFDAGAMFQFVYPALALVIAAAFVLALHAARVVFEREQVRGAFARFVPESVVSEVLAQTDGVRLGGVERESTILFSDLRGFTTFAERRNPSETIEILNRYLTMMSDAILEHGGTLVAYMGDGIMAVFGAPLAQADHADRALAAARAMLDHLEKFNQWLRSEGLGDGFKMGIGLNSGQVMSGNVGSERRLEYTAIGDTTNTASRLEGMTKGTPHQIYVAQSTYDLLRNPPDDLVCLGEFDVRGRVGCVPVWTLEGPPSHQPAREA